MTQKVIMTEWPGIEDWMEVKRRALITVGKKPLTQPDETWKRNILKARHSPIRYLRFSFDVECPYWVSVHLSRHVHAQPYIKSQRNDKQNEYDRNSAPQNETVNMIWDMNAEELMTVCNKRLCMQASPETRNVVTAMCERVVAACPEFKELLWPTCIDYGKCREMHPCGLSKQAIKEILNGF